MPDVLSPILAPILSPIAMDPLALSQGVGVVLPTFALGSEAAAVVAAMSGSAPSTRRQWAMNRLVSRLKGAGVWSLLTALYSPSEVQANCLINWITPGTHNLTVVGSPTFASPQAAVNGADPNASVKGLSAPTSGIALDTGITLASVSGTSFSAGVFQAGGLTASAAEGDLGAIDSTAGVLLNSLATGTTTAKARCFGTDVSTIGVSGNWTGNLFSAIARGSNTNFDVYHNALLVASPASTYVASSSSNTIRFLKATGATTQSSRGFLAGFIGQYLTTAQMTALYAAIRWYVETVEWGDVDIRDAGYQPQNVTADVLVYGWTSQAVNYAYEAARQGLSVAMIGGWNDYTTADIGGTSTNGLGAVDIDATAAIGGTELAMINRARSAVSPADSSLKFQPKTLNWVMRQCLDPAKTGGQAVTLYATGGVKSASNAGSNYVLRTNDGRVFTATRVRDFSYEGDALLALGVPLTYGREAAGSGHEAVNGFQGIQTSSGQLRGEMSWLAQPASGAQLVSVDPYVTPATPASGLVAGVSGNLPGLSNGAADTGVQSMNFRLSFCSSANKGSIPWAQFFTAPPPNYAASNHELLGRVFAAITAASQTASLATIFSEVFIGSTSIADMNNSGGYSTDLMGSGNAFHAAGLSASAKLAVYQSVRNNILGLLYYILDSGDSRIPAAIVTAVSGIFFADDHNLDPGPNGLLFFPNVMYVRENWRLAAGIGGAVLIADDFYGTDGTAPRISAHTAGAASYALDRHHIDRYVDSSVNPARVWNEGGFNQSPTGGTDHITPIPFEILMPDKSVMPDVATSWSGATTSAAYGAFRLEMQTSQMAQTLALADTVAKTNGITIQDAVTAHYSDITTLAAATPEATKPVMPTVN